MLQEAGLHGMLIIGDGAFGIGKGGLEVGDGVGRSLTCNNVLRWCAACKQSGAEAALGVSEALPIAPPSPVTELAVHEPQGGGDALSDGLE